MAKAEVRDQDVPGCVVSTDVGRAWYQKGALSKVSNADGEKKRGRQRGCNQPSPGREGGVGK